MDLPPSGWYPDPYQTPGLLRWWDGAQWTHHTHQDPGAAAGSEVAGPEPAQAVQAQAVQAQAGQAYEVQAQAVQAYEVQAQADPATGQLRRVAPHTAQPPTGPRTNPQPALPVTTVQPTTVQPTTVQPTTVQPTTVQPTTVQPTTMQQAVQPTSVQQAVQPTSVQQAVQPTSVQQAVQPTSVQQAVQPTTVDRAVAAAATTVDPPQQAAGWQPTPAGAAVGASVVGASVAGGSVTGGSVTGGTADGSGTQVLFLGGDSWQVPGGPGQAGPGQGNRYGYQQAVRRRRWLMGGLAVGTAAAVAVIAVIVASLDSSPSSTTADQTPTVPASHAPATPSPSPTPSSSPSSSPSATATSGGSLLSDGQSGLSYTQLPSPWQPTCPADLNNGAFTWTAGESAIAGQVNGGQTTWYGEACSGPLPQQYGYTGVQDLQTVAANLASTFQNAYYSALQHTVTPEVSQPVQVSGHAGWEVTYLVSYTDAAAQGATWSDEQAAVIIADTGTGNTPAVFFTSIPGNLNESNVSTVVTSLQLTVVPNASASPTDTTAPSDFGSPPGGGDGNNGNNP